MGVDFNISFGSGHCMSKAAFLRLDSIVFLNQVPNAGVPLAQGEGVEGRPGRWAYSDLCCELEINPRDGGVVVCAEGRRERKRVESV